MLCCYGNIYTYSGGSITMGVDTMQWRVRIGLFIQPVGKKTLKNPAILLIPSRCKTLRLFLRLALYLSMILMLCGDVELNPGPPDIRSNTRQMSQSKLSWEKGDNPIDSLSRTLQEIRSEMSNISTNFSEMRGEMTSVNDNIDKLNMKIDSKIDMLQQENSELKIRVSSLENQVEKLEVMSRKYNLVFVGIDDKPHDAHTGRSTITEDGASGNSGARRETWVD
jgi:prefoldin subunit 5